MRQSTRLIDTSSDEGATEQTATHQPREPCIDPVTVLRALDCDHPLHVEPVSGGADTLIWRVETPTGSYALRLFRSSQVQAAAREVAAMTAARDHGLPVPALVRQGMWHDRPALVLSWMPGLTLRAALAARRQEGEALGAAFGRAQARIHQCLSPTALHDNNLDWVDIPGGDPDIISRVRSACARSTALLHLDYHPLNVLVERHTISAILDWPNARSGDPRCDLARTETILIFAPLREGETQTARDALLAGWRRGYTAVAGPVEGMRPFWAWAAAFMAHDLRPRLGRPDLPWLTEEWLERVKAWATEPTEEPGTGTS